MILVKCCCPIGLCCYHESTTCRSDHKSREPREGSGMVEGSPTRYLRSHRRRSNSKVQRYASDKLVKKAFRVRNFNYLL
jgi:hypothetical protein